MMTKRPLLFFALFLACGGVGTSDGSGPETTRSGTEGLIASLRDAGLTVEAVDQLSETVFSIPADVYRVAEKGELQVYRFADPGAAETAASSVSSNGYTIGRSQIHWFMPPRFYRRDELIVIQLGGGEETTRVLTRLMGEPFAKPAPSS